MALPSHGGNVRLKNEGSVKIDMSFRVLCVKSLIGFFVDVRNLFLRDIYISLLGTENEETRTENLQFNRTYQIDLRLQK